MSRVLRWILKMLMRKVDDEHDIGVVELVVSQIPEVVKHNVKRMPRGL